MNLRSQSVHIALVGGVVFFAFACAQPRKHSGTVGARGEVEFAYQGPGCFFGCPLERPLLVGTHARITLTDPGDVAGLAVASSHANIAEFAVERACHCERDDGSGAELDVAESGHCPSTWTKRCDNTVLVGALATGTARLQLRDAHGQAIDDVAVVVHEAKSAELEASYPDRLGQTELGDLSLAADQSVPIDASIYDADGLTLLAPDGVHWEVDDDSVAIVTAFLVASGRAIDAGTSVELQAKGPGTTTLTLRVPGLERKMAVEVTSN